MAAIETSELNNIAEPEQGKTRGEVFGILVAAAIKAANAQLDKFAGGVADALMQLSDGSTDAKEASASFNSSNLLRKNIYAFHFLASGVLQKALKQELDHVEAPTKLSRPKAFEGLSLVPYEDMDRKLLLGNISRPLESANAERITALRLRLASLLGRDEVSSNQNPFRPEVFLAALNDAWRDFNPDGDAHGMFLPLFKQQDTFLDLGPIYDAVNEELINAKVLPELADHYNIKKTGVNKDPNKRKNEGLDAAAMRQLRQLLGAAGLPGVPNLPGSTAQNQLDSLTASVPMIPSIPVADIPMIPGLPSGTGVAGAGGVGATGGAGQAAGMPMMPGGHGQSGVAGGMPVGTAYGNAAGGVPMAGAPMIPGMDTSGSGGMGAGAGGFPAIHGIPAEGGFAGTPMGSGGGQMAGVTSGQLLSFLSGMQRMQIAQQPAAQASYAVPTPVLANIKAAAPQGMMTRVDESTVDLLTKIFDVVFRDKNIPAEIKGLIGFLQVPVLKAALADKEFFFKEEHPARRLIELLTKTSVGWDQSKGQDDPLYQTIKRNVNRVQEEFDQQATVFSDVVSDLESFLQQEEKKSTEELSEPIAQALKQEKLQQATKAAQNDVAMRIGTGEVVAFIETFLENKWVPVLTLAYSIQDEKPKALESALKTMDDLIWSVKPKITLEERKELIAKLPSMLSTLNKWLNLVKLDDAERLQFFAELAECHASIVRAPLEMSADRRLELAMEAAQVAAERRLEKKAQEEAAAAAAEPVPEPDEVEQEVTSFDRGTWFEFVRDNVVEKVKLSWVSPLRSLYIFTSQDKKTNFSLSDAELATALREERARVILLTGLVDRAISEALEDAGANDPDMDAQTAA
jgi:hypothetical protein